MLDIRKLSEGKRKLFLSGHLPISCICSSYCCVEFFMLYNHYRKLLYWFLVVFCSLGKKATQNVLGSHQMDSFLFLALLMDLLRYMRFNVLFTIVRSNGPFYWFASYNLLHTRFGIILVENLRRISSIRLKWVLFVACSSA